MTVDPTAPTLLVVAKSPVPGQVKTRLRPAVSAHQSAALAAAALLDTLDVVRAAADAVGSTPVIALSGDLSEGAAPDALQKTVADFRVVVQRGESFAERLAAAHRDAAQGGGATVQVGMDTPQLQARHLIHAAERVADDNGPDAVLGPAEDGGWWLLALRRAADAEVLVDVEMSTADTGELTLAALRAAGLEVELTITLRDVDHLEDLGPVASLAPASRFASLVGVLGHDQPTRRPVGLVETQPAGDVAPR